MPFPGRRAIKPGGGVGIVGNAGIGRLPSLNSCNSCNSNTTPPPGACRNHAPSQPEFLQFLQFQHHPPTRGLPKSRAFPARTCNSCNSNTTPPPGACRNRTPTRPEFGNSHNSGATPPETRQNRPPARPEFGNSHNSGATPSPLPSPPPCANGAQVESPAQRAGKKTTNDLSSERAGQTACHAIPPVRQKRISRRLRSARAPRSVGGVLLKLWGLPKSPALHSARRNRPPARSDSCNSHNSGAPPPPRK